MNSTDFRCCKCRFQHRLRNVLQHRSLLNLNLTRIHSSRMRTARSSSHPGGVSTSHPLRSRHPLSRARHLRDQATPHNQVPSWDQALPKQAPPSRHPRAGTPQDQAPPRTRHPPGPDPPVNRISDTCKNITFPQLRLRAVTILLPLEQCDLLVSICFPIITTNILGNFLYQHMEFCNMITLSYLPSSK